MEQGRVERQIISEEPICFVSDIYDKDNMFYNVDDDPEFKKKKSMTGLADIIANFKSSNKIEEEDNEPKEIVETVEPKKETPELTKSSINMDALQAARQKWKKIEIERERELGQTNNNVATQNFTIPVPKDKSGNIIIRKNEKEIVIEIPFQ